MDNVILGFFQGLKQRFPQYFKDCRVVDFGSLNVNGELKHFFNNCDYTGVDVVAGDNVDCVSLTHEFEVADPLFDTVVSSDMLEHDPHYIKSLQKMVQLVRPGGFLAVTCKAGDFPAHGLSDDKNAPLASSKLFNDYYRNVNMDDVHKAVSLAYTFSKYDMTYKGGSLLLWGIKKEV